MPPLPATNLEELFAHWAQQTPHNPALLGPGRSSLSFSQLGDHLRTFQETLREFGLGRGTRLALLAPNSPELALAFLCGSTSAICAPLNPAYQREELAFYLEDLEASALLISCSLDSPAREVAQARSIPVLEISTQMDRPAGSFSLEGQTGLASEGEQATTKDDIALILHTSGTTARPKQVPLTHANLCASIHHLQQSLALTTADRCLNLMPLFHIHGLVGALLAGLGSGGQVVCPPSFSPSEFFPWLRAFQPTWYTTVPTIHQAILKQARTEDRPRASAALRFIRSSSASLPPTVMEEIEDVFGVPVIEAYGMTEAAHQMTSNPLPPRIRKPGSVGLPAGPEVAILSEAGAILVQGEVGEVGIRGPNVMRGYQSHPQANTQAFSDDWFRTGDQGYFDHEGYLFLTGRLKELINRGGEKISPIEIDQALLRHSRVQQAVTFAMPHPTLGEDVAAAVVLDGSPDITESALQQFLSVSVADFKIPRRIVFVPEIPLGPTGKLQRTGLAEKLLGTEEPSNGKADETPKTALEEQIADLWKGVLSQEQIGRHEPFLQLGGDSISGAQLRSRIREIFQVDVPWLSLFQEADTIATLASFIEAQSQHQAPAPFPPLVTQPDQTSFPLTSVQEPLWLATQLDPDSTASHRPLLLQFTGPLDIEVLERSLHEIMQRHTPLRTVFPLDSEGPRQIVLSGISFTLSRRDLSQVPASELPGKFTGLVNQAMENPFDLSLGPVFRGTLYQVNDLDHRLLIVFHHLVYDGWSDAVFFRELETLYNSFICGDPSPLPTLSIHYGDFALWQQQRLSGPNLDRQVTYWTTHLTGFRPSPFQPPGHASNTLTPGSSQRKMVALSPLQTTALRKFSQVEGVTPFTILLAGFFIFLHRWTQENDLIVGVPIANRIHPLLEPLIGYFVNVLPFRSIIYWENSLRSFVQKLYTFALGAYTNSEVPIQEIRKTLDHSENLIGQSLLQVLFVFENAPQYVPKLKNLHCQPLALPGGDPLPVNLSLLLWDHPEQIRGHVVFNHNFIKRDMITAFIAAYPTILESIIHRPDESIQSISIDFNSSLNAVEQKEGKSTPVNQRQAVTEQKISGDETPLSRRRENLRERISKLPPSQQELLKRKLDRRLRSTDH